MLTVAGSRVTWPHVLVALVVFVHGCEEKVWQR